MAGELIVPWRPGAVAVIYLPVRGVVKSLAVEPFIRRLRELKPEVPILICENINVDHGKWRAFSRAVYERLKREDAAAWRDLHYLARR